MSTRFKTPSRQNYGIDPLPTGFGGKSDPELSIPSVGIEDVDLALFNLFDKEINLQASGIDGASTTKVPVIFAAGEKWALLKNGQPLRDKQNSLILPLITIIRTNKKQSIKDDVTGRGINQQQGELVIQKRLGVTDRTYQGIINRLHLQGQDGLAVGPSEASDGLRTRRSIGELEDDATIKQGGLLMGDVKNNVVETIVIPAPQFYTAVYEVTVWTQHIQHANQVMEQLFASMLPQAQCWRIETQTGYWFVASPEGDSMNLETNVENMSDEERYIKHKMTINVPAYILATSKPGQRVPIKKYVSNPEIEFTISTDLSPDEIDEPFLGSDDPTLPQSVVGEKRRDGRHSGRSRVFVSNADGKIDPNDPALLSYPRGLEPGKYKKIITSDGVKFVRIKKTNSSTGEQTFGAGFDLGSFSIIVVDK